MKLILPFITTLALLPFTVLAQKSNPFESIGKKAKVHTLSNGKYAETFDDAVLQRVGTVIIDRRTKKIVKLLDADSISNETSDNSTVSRWYSIDPLAEKYYSVSPYAFCDNNPIKYIDPNGMKWQNANDEAYATSLQTQLSSRIETEDKNLDKANANVASIKDQISKEGASDKLNGKLSDAIAKVGSITSTISDLTKSVNEIAKMGNASDQVFTYDHVENSEVAYTGKQSDGVMHIGYTSDANGVHETAHGYDDWKGTMSANTLDREVMPYQRQYSFDRSSMPASDYGNIRQRSDIQRNWVLFIHSSQYFYPYFSGNHNPSTGAIKDMLKLIKDSEKQ